MGARSCRAGAPSYHNALGGRASLRRSAFGDRVSACRRVGVSACRRSAFGVRRSAFGVRRVGGIKFNNFNKERHKM